MKKPISIYCFFLLLLIVMAPVKATRAGVIGIDDSLGGFSKVLDDYYEALTKTNQKDEAREYIEERKKQLNILYRIVEAEATDGTLEQKMNVASCVLARVASPDWPDTIEGVVFQKKQFSPISDGRYYTVTVTDSTIEAVTLVRQQGLRHSCVWFCTPTCSSAKTGFHSKLKFAFNDGMHNFYH